MKEFHLPLTINQHVLEHLHLLEAAAGAERDAGQRIVGDRDRQAGRMAQHEVEIAEQRAAAGQHDALVDDVGGELRRRVLERDLDRLDDGADRLGQALGDLPLGDDDLLRARRSSGRGP